MKTVPDPQKPHRRNPTHAGYCPEKPEFNETRCVTTGPRDVTLGILRQFARVYKVEAHIPGIPVAMCPN